MDFAVGRVVEGHMEISLFHELADVPVFAVALAGMFALSSLLEGRHWKRKAEAGESPPEDEAAPLPTVRSLVGPVIAFCVLCAGTLVLCSSITGQPLLSAPGVVMDLPPSLGQAQGLELPMTQRERGGLAADITLSRYQYLAADRSPVLATIVVSAANSRRGLHRPDVCLPGQGWSIMDRQALPVPLPDDPGHEAMMLRVFRDLPREDGTWRACAASTSSGMRATVACAPPIITRTCSEPTSTPCSRT